MLLNDSLQNLSSHAMFYTYIDQTVGSSGDEAVISGNSKFVIDAQSGFRISNYCHVEVRGHFTGQITNATSVALFRVRGDYFNARNTSIYAGHVFKEYVSGVTTTPTSTACMARWIESSGSYWIRDLSSSTINSGEYRSYILDYLGS